jgi:hypothetical protein
MARIGPRRPRAWDNQAISLICQFLSNLRAIQAKTGPEFASAPRRTR